MEQLGLLLRQNSDWAKVFTFPWDMSGCQVHLQCVNTTLVDFQTANGTMTLTPGATSSQVSCKLTAAQVGAIPVPPIYPTTLPNGEQGTFLDNFILSIKWPDGTVSQDIEGPIYIAAGKPF